jgi:hypothetical protein
MTKKIPTAREIKKPAKAIVPAPDETTQSSYAVPPSLRQVRREGRDWTQDEIIAIVKFQQYLQRRSVGLRPRDFRRLFSDAGGCCALTGYKFGDGDEFDIGITRISSRRQYHQNNYRLVLLPLSYSPVRAHRYNVQANKIPDSYQNRPLARSILLSLRDAILDEPRAKDYPFSIDFSDSLIRITAPVFPVTRWCRHTETDKNDVHICWATLHDARQSLEIGGYEPYHRLKYNVTHLSLHDPTIDLAQFFRKVFCVSFPLVLKDRALRYLREWKY